MMQTELLERIPAQDWEATPASVRTLLLSLLPLETEVSALRARLLTFDQNRETASNQIQLTGSDRYQDLVEKLLISGLSAEETQEMERLGAQMDTQSAPFYKAALLRMKAASKYTQLRAMPPVQQSI